MSIDLSANPLLVTGAVFLAGVATSLTPCLYPMIPITVSIVGTGDAAHRRLTRIGLVGVYVIGLAAAYAVLGLVAGLTGTLFGSVSTNPWLQLGMANVMLAAAAMMADLIPVPIPTRLRARAASAGVGGKVTGVLVMGLFSGLVAAPCGAPVMAAILTWVKRAFALILLGVAEYYLVQMGTLLT